MRKKSHIDLARYLINNCDECKYRKTVYLGSILPDLIPTFIYKRHRIDITLGIVRKELEKMVKQDKVSRMYCLRVGIVSHYISDYFTLPHNKEFVGSIKEHCKYEKELIERLREKLSNAKREHNNLKSNKVTVNDMLDYIVEKHKEYIKTIKSFKHTIDDDCNYIASVDMDIIQLIHFAKAYEIARSHKNFLGDTILQTSVS